MFHSFNVKQTLEISLRFMYNVDDEITSQLNSRLLKYYNSFQGYFLAFKSVRNLSKGKNLRIYTSTPCVYVKIEYEALIFSPSKNCVIRGEITSVTGKSVYVQVLGFIQGILRKRSEEEEVEEGEKLEYYVGDMITFLFSEFFEDEEETKKIRGNICKDSVVYHKDQSENFSVMSFQSSKSNFGMFGKE